MGIAFVKAKQLAKLKLLYIPYAVSQLAFPAGALASAAEGEVAHHADISTLFLPTINFVLFVIAMTWIYRKHLSSVVQGRSANIADHIRRSAAALHESEAEHQERCDRLRNISDEKKELELRFEDEGLKLAEMVIAQAHSQAERIEADAARQIETELNQAAKEIRAEVVAQAVGEARRLLRETLSAADDRKLRRNVLENTLT